MEYKKYNTGTYSLNTIKTDKFKLGHIEVIFRNNVNVKEICKRHVLFEILTETTKNFPTKRKLRIKLEDLYNAKVYAVTSKVGNAVITNVCMDFLNPEYSDKNILRDAIDLLFEVIFNPNAVNREFDNQQVKIAKLKTEESINSIKENPRKQAVIECLKTLNENPTSHNGIGTLDELAEITPENLYDYYEQVLSNDFIDIYAVGNFDMDFVQKYINSKCRFKVIKDHAFNIYVNNPKRKMTVNSSTCPNVQTNLVVLLDLQGLSRFEKNYVANLYNIILGGGSLSSKLYKKLREENSLCYNVNANYLKYNNLIMISTGIDINAKDKCIKLIKEVLKDMSCNISDDELMESKELIMTSLNTNYDSAGKIVDNRFYYDLGVLDSVEDRIKEFNKVTKEDIYKLNKKISICNIYALEGESNE